MSSTNTPTVGPLDPIATTPLPLQPGDVVAGRYEILRLLGSGGSAFVYAVHDRTIGDEIALKLLREGKRSDIDIERTRREAEFARGSTSPRLVRTFDLLESDGLVFLTMELVPGGSLRGPLRCGPLPIGEVIRLACEILEALADLHRLDLVHRDLKPGNLLLTADGHVKLSDFGIARRWTEEDSRLTVTGLPVGTVDYLSPEQAAAEKVDPRSDLYSLGIVLFEMLTGRVPFEAPSAVGSIVKRLHRRARDVRTLRPDTPRWLAAVVARLLEKKREDRYQSAEAVLVDLHRRRARLAWRSVRIAGVTLILIAAAVLGVWRGMRSGKTQLVADGEWGVRVVDAEGKTLWTRPDTAPHCSTIVRRGNDREIAAILAPSGALTNNPAYARTLSFFDLRTGRFLRRRTLLSAAPSFPQFSDRFAVAQVRATDLNADGYDEVAVTYAHDFWPSYIVMHDLRRDEGRVIFVASGHQRIEQTEDVDGDGVADLIVSGLSNRMGWYVGLAAVRVPLDGSSDDYAAFTPDRDALGSRSLIWYALNPQGALHRHNVTVDRKRRVFRMNYYTRAPIEVTFDGFAVNSTSALSPPQREAARERAYAHLRDSRRLVRGGDAQGAIAEAAAARAIAARMGDAWLHEWSGRLQGVAMIHAGRFAEAAAFFNSLCAGSEAAADIAWDAGTAFHLAGELPRAVEWFQRSLGRAGNPFVGRQKYESIQGIVLALGEMGQWDAASKEIDAFMAAYPLEAGLGDWYHQYASWRTGGHPPSRYAEELPHDLFRYWALELALARGEDPGVILKTIDRDRRRTSETRTLLLLARSEALRRAGETEEALRIARDAFEALRAERRTDTLARAHFDLAAERLSRLADAKGLTREAERVRGEAAALRWHPNGTMH